MKKHANLFILFFLFTVSFVIRINSLNNSFVLDDFRLIIDNSFIQNIDNFFKVANPRNLFDVLPIVCGARPISVISLMADFFIFGQNPFGYHLINLILHSFNAVLLFLFVFNLTKDRMMGLISALFFSIHPIQSEVVNIASFRADLLFVFFTLIFLNLTNLFKNIKENKKKLIIVFMFFTFICALFSKENAVVIPLILLSYIAFFYKENRIKYLFVTTVFVTAIFLFFFWIERFPVPLYNLIYPSIENNIMPLNSFVTYINIIFSSLYYNFMHIVYPVNLSVDYFVNYSNLISSFVIFLILFLISVFLGFKIKNRYFKFTLFFTIIVYLPVSNIIPLVNTIADRYMYLPMLGISMIFGYVIVKLLKIGNPKIIYVFVIILFSIYALISYQRAKVYSNQYTLYQDAVSKNSQNVRTAYNMAVAYVANKEFNNAIKQFDDVIKINPIYRRDQVWLLTAMSYESLGQKDLAKKYYHKAFLLHHADKYIITRFIETFNSFQEAKQYLVLNTVRLDKQALANFEKNAKE
ncbi:MAG: hypothetical protein PHR82_03890 [Endomicrobiaceae bacterium]|nr:hypothetical protein [Endomicrobiaceae bacterium]